MMNKKSHEHSGNLLIFFLGFKVHWWAKSYYTLGSPNGLPQNSFLHFPQKILIFRKKIFNMKIFSIKFVIKKVILNFGVR